MKTYFEMEGKLGPKCQTQSDQSRLAQLKTNPCVRRKTKMTEKRKKLLPTKKYKVKLVARPESKTSNTTVQPPLTTPNASANLERQNPPQEGTSESNAPPLKSIPTCTGTPWPKAGKMLGNLFKLRKAWPIPPTATSKPPIKSKATDPIASNPECHSSTKIREMWMGTRLPHL